MAIFGYSNNKKESRPRRVGGLGRSPVTQYYRSDAQSGAQSPFEKKQPKKNGRRIIVAFLDIVLIVALVAGVFYSMMIKPQPKVIVSDLSYHPKAVYENEVVGQLGNLKNRNKITFNEKSMADTLQAKFPEISAVDVELPFFSERPVVRLSVAKPSFKLQSQFQDYVINAEGTAIAPLTELPQLDYLTNVTDQSGFNIKSGSRVLSSSSVNFINYLIRQSKSAKVPISSLTLPSTAEELVVRTSDQPYFIKFYLEGDPSNQVGQFLAVRQQFKKTGKGPSQYLDVRVNGKIFYK